MSPLNEMCLVNNIMEHYMQGSVSLLPTPEYFYQKELFMSVSLHLFASKCNACTYVTIITTITDKNRKMCLSFVFTPLEEMALASFLLLNTVLSLTVKLCRANTSNVCSAGNNNANLYVVTHKYWTRAYACMGRFQYPSMYLVF